MKIAFFVSEFPTISETFILNQIVGLIEKGIEVEIFPLELSKTPPVHSLINKHQLLKKTHCYDIPQNRLFRWLKLIFFSRYAFLINPKLLKIFWTKEKINRRLKLELFFRGLAMKRRKFDIIHCHFGPNGFQAVWLKKLGLFRGKIMTSFHGYDFSAFVKTQGREVYHQLFQEADLITVNSDFTGQKLQSLGANKKKIVKLPMGLRIEEFQFNPKKLKPKEKIKILTVARLVEKKGLEYSIRAVAKLIKKHSHLEYRIVGDGPLKEELTELIKKLGAERKIKLLGWQDRNQVKKLYQWAHLFVLASVTAKTGDQEGQGVVLQEAQVCGLPLVATQHNGFPEGVLEGQSGFLVAERDVKALEKKLDYLINHPQIWPEMGQTGRKFVEKKYNIDKLTKELIRIYQGLLD